MNDDRYWDEYDEGLIEGRWHDGGVARETTGR